MEKLALLIENHGFACFYKKHFGMACPGCGFQRSVVHLLRGEFAESFQLYPALIPTIFMIVFLFIHVFFKFKNGAKILLALFGINAALIVGNYIVKLIQ